MLKAFYRILKAKPFLIPLIAGISYFIFCYAGGFLQYQFDNDEPSYRLLPLNSLVGALSSHRTVGFPLFLQGFEGLGLPLRLWPFLQWGLLTLSLVGSGLLFLRAGFSGLLSLLVVGTLAFNPQILENLGYARSEALSLGCLFLALGFFLCLLFQPRGWDAWGFGFFLFLTYQIRPALGFVAFLFAFCTFLGRENKKTAFSVSALPLFFFFLIRWAVVGDFGLVSYSGTNLVGHAMMDLTPETIAKLPSHHQALGNTLLTRKSRALAYCTESETHSYDERIRLRFPCHNYLQMTAWQTLVEFRYGRIPFVDPRLNIEPWKHVQTLSAYFSVPNVEIDQRLGYFSRAVIRIAPQSNWRWVSSGFLYSLTETWRTLPAAWLILLSLLILTKTFSPSPGSTFFLFAILFCVGGNFTTVLFSVPNARYYGQFAVFLLALVPPGIYALRKTYPVGVLSPL